VPDVILFSLIFLITSISGSIPLLNATIIAENSNIATEPAAIATAANGFKTAAPTAARINPNLIIVSLITSLPFNTSFLF